MSTLILWEILSKNSTYRSDSQKELVGDYFILENNPYAENILLFLLNFSMILKRQKLLPNTFL